MDDSLRIIQYLYGDEIDDPDFPQRVAQDKRLRREFERLQDTKDALDRRSSPSPDPDVVDRVVDRAATAGRSSTLGEHAPDRTARAPDRNWPRPLQNASAALALVLAFGLGWWYAQGGARPTAPATSEPAPQRTAAAAPPSKQAPDEEALPKWDDRDEVVRLHQRIEVLQTQNRSDAWGGNLQPASRTRP